MEDLFPLNLWESLIPQIDMQVNLLGQANAMPKLSAYAYLNVPHNFNRMPIEPLGCALQIHKIPTAGHCGHPTQSMGDTLERPLSTIADTLYGAYK